MEGVLLTFDPTSPTLPFLFKLCTQQMSFGEQCTCGMANPSAIAPVKSKCSASHRMKESVQPWVNTLSEA